MHKCGWLVLGLVFAIGCVDLSEPPELGRPAVVPGSETDAAAVDSGIVATGPDAPPADGPAPDGVVPSPDTPASSPDQKPADANAPVAPDAGTPADTAAPDAAAPPMPDAALPDAPAPDAFVAPDVAPDVSPDTTPDTAPDVAPDVSPDVSPDLAPVAPDVAPDTTPVVPPLVIDDFQGAIATRNSLNSDVTWDNQTCAHVSGEMVCTWSGQGVFQDFIETINNWCAFDARGYSKVRFRMRASAAGKLVDVYASLSTGSCPAQQKPVPVIGTVTTTTVMTTYEFPITTLARERLALIEFGPRTIDGTQYVLDDLQLVP